MFRRPAEALPPLKTLADDDAVRGFRQEWAAQLRTRHSLWTGSLRANLRAWAGRVTGRADRRLLLALANATDAIATQCDSVVNRLTDQEALTSDIASALGEELTHLRAEVLRLRDVLTALEHQGND